MALFGLLDGLPSIASLEPKTGEVVSSIQIRADRSETIRTGALFISDGSQASQQEVYATFVVAGDKL